jgi:hypothetical protein
MKSGRNLQFRIVPGLSFVSYGPDATFTQNDVAHWQIDYNGGASHDVITFSNAASIHASDFLFT